MQVGVPRRHHGDAQQMGNPETKRPHVARAGDVNQIGPKVPQRFQNSIPVTSQKWIAVDILIHFKSEAAFQFNEFNGTGTQYPGLRATINATERDVPAFRPDAELLAQPANAVTFMKRIGEQRDAEGIRHQ